MKVLLVYPFFRPKYDRSTFRFPPLGLGYLAASLRRSGHDVAVLDCTFLERRTAREQALRHTPDVVGIYAMYPFQEDSLQFARHLRGRCRLLVAGGPLASCDPLSFTADFDIVVRGEGETTLGNIVAACEGELPLGDIPGIAYHDPADRSNGVRMAPPQEMSENLDTLPLPARELFPNRDYITYWRRKSGEATTTIITSRGCPFRCEFCSNAVFGNSYRERSAAGVVDEVESALRLGYDRIHFADDVFTLRKARVLSICDEIKARRLRFRWECLCRVDLLDREMATAMKEAGCDRVFFGIESANERVLRTMRKGFAPGSARRAVELAASAGLRTGAFFIVCYPGDTTESTLETLRFSTSLPLDYLSFTLPYPIPGTALYERMRERVRSRYRMRGSALTEHFLTYRGDFSEAKMRFAVFKGNATFKMRKKLGRRGELAVRGFERVTDRLFRLMR